MTLEEQQQFCNIVELISDSSTGLRARVNEWGKTHFENEQYRVSDAGSNCLMAQYRIAGSDRWTDICTIDTREGRESTDDLKRRHNKIKNLFYDINQTTSNQLGDAVAVRCVPFIAVFDRETVHYRYEYKEDEARVKECTDTGERPQWNQLNIKISTEPSTSVRTYDIQRSQVQAGDDLCWYQSWHFFLEEDAPSPVAPIIVEEADDYHIVLRYRDQLIHLGPAADMQHEATLEKAVPVTPTKNWYVVYLPNPYTFDLQISIRWAHKLYDPDTKEKFQQVPAQQYSTSDLPEGVRTMQQIDHDAWEEASGRRFVPEGY